MKWKINNSNINNIQINYKNIIDNIFEYIPKNEYDINKVNILNNLILNKLQQLLKFFYLTIDNKNINNYEFLFSYTFFKNNYQEYFINLVYLNCSNTDIEYISENLINLKVLNCNNTKLFELPETLINLEYLNIFNTNILILPKTFTKLKELHADGTFLEKISKNLINLNKITINNTNINKIKYYEKLEYLDCHNSYIDNIDINTIQNIKYLNISNTLIESNQFIDESLVSKWTNNNYTFNNLIYLDCSNTNLIKLPKKLNNLKYLNISNTLIEDISYLELNNLNILYANHTILKKLNYNTIELIILDLSNNKIIKTIPKTLRNITILNISNTYNIKKISNKINKLEYLDCSNSNITKIPIVLNNLYYLNIINTSINYNYYTNKTKYIFKYCNI
jgi:hypothetical protein